MAAAPMLGDGSVLGDGSNPEGVDPSPPLGWKSKSDLTHVVLYGLHVSPPTTKIRTYLAYYGIEPKCVEAMGKKGSDYKQMPVLDVNGRQVNDSFIIVKNLVPALVGPGNFDEEFEKRVTFGLQPQVELMVVETSTDMQRWIGGPHGFGVPDCLLCCAAPILRDGLLKPALTKAIEKSTTEYGLKPSDTLTFFKEMKASMGSNKFLSGSEVGQKDLSVFGTVCTFLYKKCPTVIDTIDQAGMTPWSEAMQKIVPCSKLFPLIAPESAE